MSKLFIDTSGWASLLIPTEPYHQQAAKCFRQAQQTRQKLITNNYVVTELVALLGSRQKTSRPKLF